MQAAICWEFNRRMEVRDDVDLLPPGPGEVRVKIAATGVCHSDLSVWNESLPLPWLPSVLGHEAAGEVVEIGENVVNVSVGDHVVLWPISFCGSCRLCLAGQPHLCVNFGLDSAGAPFRVEGQAVYRGLVLGTFAAETVVPANCAIRVPSDVPLDILAVLGCGVITGVGAAVNVARVRPGSSVVVIGCGGVGMSVIQGARIAGAAELVAIDVVDTKLELARHFGATHVGHPDDLPALIAELTDDIGFDYAFEVVGRSDTIRVAADAARRGGVVVIVGAGRMDDQVEFSAFEFSYTAKEIRSCTMGGADPRTEFDRLIRLWRAGRLDLEGMITHRTTLHGLNDAFAALERGEGLRTIAVF